MAWRIYYSGGAAWSSADGPAEQAPAQDVQVIAQTASPVVAQEVGATLLHSKDYYWFERGEWFGGDLFGLFDYLLRAQGTALVKFGRFVPRAQFQAALDRATSESGKHAWYPTETR